MRRSTFYDETAKMCALQQNANGGRGAAVDDETDPKLKPNSRTPIQNEIERKIKLAELGLRERRAAARSGKPGDIGFDDLGNAQYQWKDDRMLEETPEGETRRHRALSIANLVLVEDDPPPDLKGATINTKGLRVGYNPYDSGRLPKDKWKKPRDLRALSKWIEAQKRGPAPDDNDNNGDDK